MLKFDDRFARQDRCEPPPEFPLASPCSSIVHHLSGLSARALAPRPLAASRPRAGAAPPPPGDGSRPFCLSCASGVRPAHRLARVLNSLVRVSRRVGRSAGNHTARTPGAARHRAARRAERRDGGRARSPSPASACPPRRAAPAQGVHRGRSSPAGSADAAAAYNTARVRAPPPCRRASDDPAGGRRAPPPPSAPSAALAGG